MLFTTSFSWYHFIKLFGQVWQVFIIIHINKTYHILILAFALNIHYISHAFDVRLVLSIVQLEIGDTVPVEDRNPKFMEFYYQKSCRNLLIYVALSGQEGCLKKMVKFALWEIFLLAVFAKLLDLEIAIIQVADILIGN